MSLTSWIFPFSCKSDFSSIYKFALVSQPLAAQCVVHGPAASGSFPGMWDFRPHPDSLQQNLHVHKISRWFVCMGNFEMHWHDPQKSQTPATLWRIPSSVYLKTTLMSECWFLNTKTPLRDTAPNKDSLQGQQWNASETSVCRWVSPLWGSLNHTWVLRSLPPDPLYPVISIACHSDAASSSNIPTHCSTWALGSVFQSCREGIIAFKPLAAQLKKNWSFATWKKKTPKNEVMGE